MVVFRHLRFPLVVVQLPLSTSSPVVWRFLCCVPLDCHQMLVGYQKLCLSFPIHRFHLQSLSCRLRQNRSNYLTYTSHQPIYFFFWFTFFAKCASESSRTFTTKSFTSVSSLTCAIVETGTAAAGILFKRKLNLLVFDFLISIKFLFRSSRPL